TSGLMNIWLNQGKVGLPDRTYDRNGHGAQTIPTVRPTTTRLTNARRGLRQSYIRTITTIMGTSAMLVSLVGMAMPAAMPAAINIPRWPLLAHNTSAQMQDRK